MIIIFVMNNKNEFKRAIPQLIVGTSIICIIFYLLFRQLDAYAIFSSIGIYCSLDLMRYLIKNKKKKSEWKIRVRIYVKRLTERIKQY